MTPTLNRIAALLVVPWAALVAATPPAILAPVQFQRICAVSSAPPIRTAAELLRGFLTNDGPVDKVRLSTGGTSDQAPAAGTVFPQTKLYDFPLGIAAIQRLRSAAERIQP